MRRGGGEVAVMPDPFTSNLSFAGVAVLQGETFTLVLGPGAEIAMTLASVERRHPPPGVPLGFALRSEPFALFFETPVGFLLPQDNYTLTHPALGETVMCLVPVAERPGGGYRYQAVFT